MRFKAIIDRSACFLCRSFLIIIFNCLPGGLIPSYRINRKELGFCHVDNEFPFEFFIVGKITQRKPGRRSDYCQLNSFFPGQFFPGWYIQIKFDPGASNKNSCLIRGFIYFLSFSRPQNLIIVICSSETSAAPVMLPASNKNDHTDQGKNRCLKKRGRLHKINILYLQFLLL